MAKIADYKIRGLTAASATVATQDIEFHSDGSFRFTYGSKPFIISGNNAAVNALMKIVLTGTGGFASTDRLFGNTGF